MGLDVRVRRREKGPRNAIHFGRMREGLVPDAYIGGREGRTLGGTANRMSGGAFQVMPPPPAF